MDINVKFTTFRTYYVITASLTASYDMALHVVFVNNLDFLGQKFLLLCGLMFLIYHFINSSVEFQRIRDLIIS
ncbi:protein of unknown function [Legionella fallonii LLAP-10]|uniref:Uncharacterized protein n=1 Tax=Legionella fallonii LLAP-10 TaxID=1212491 RepID=A0A098G5U2_9GAMM|nr:protein of unknown function [Legionella fallonii LLAP-10]